MRKLVLTFIASGLVVSSALAQTLFSFGNNPVTKEEFLRVYQKNAINKKPDFSEPALREYLDLYSLFRMKVKEAELQELDTLATIQSELDNYRKQLAKNYLTDEKMTNSLVEEAYNRMKEEVRVAHILIAAPMHASLGDTVVAYKRIDSIYTAVTKKGADFAALAKAFSDDRGSKPNGGDLGFVTALQTVYPFENAIYSTPVGKISTPFRSQFGYHILKVIERRPARGEVKVAQILVQTPKSKGEEGVAAARRRIDSINADMKNGVAFDQLVKKYSDDKYSINDNGVLPVISVGKVTPAFENAAFSLKKPGDISAPVQTDYGFHIIKLIERIPMKPLDSLRAGLKRRVENDSRAQVARDRFFDNVKQKNGFKQYADAMEAVMVQADKIPDTGKNAQVFAAKNFMGMDKPLFTLAGKNYLQSDFLSYAEQMTRGRIMGPKRAVMNDLYKMYVNTVVTDLEEHRLVEEHTDFKNLMQEYRDGIMLFELMDRNVWGKASKDTVGLKSFFDARKGKYMWEPGFTGAVYKFKNEKVMKEGLKLLADKKLKDEDIIKKMNSDTMPDAVTVQRGHYEFTKFTEFPRTAIVAGKVTEPKKNTDGSYSAVRVEEVFSQPTAKSLDDARGYVVAEYQDFLEKQWNEEMKKKYSLKVNESVFKSLVKN